MLYTARAKYLAKKAGAYWLIDEIALAQDLRRVAAEPFQIWNLKVRPDHTAILTCADGNSNIRLSKKIQFTDFPLDEIVIYCTQNMIMLTSEY